MAAAHWNESSDQLPRTGRKRIADDNHRGNETVHLRSPPQSLFVSLKMMTSQCCTVFIYTIVVLSTVHHSLAYNNVSSSGEELLHRMKRFLIFNNGGIVKNVMGIVCPVQFGDNSKRSLNLAYNFQSQYALPPEVINIFKAPFFTGHIKRNSRELTPTDDQSRLFMYTTLERTWDRRGRNGHECLLRAICEVAESPFGHSGIFGQIVDAIFTPHPEDEHDGAGSPFLSAREAGLRHADCGATYKLCPPGEGFLDSISHFLTH